MCWFFSFSQCINNLRKCYNLSRVMMTLWWFSFATILFFRVKGSVGTTAILSFPTLLYFPRFWNLTPPPPLLLCLLIPWASLPIWLVFSQDTLPLVPKLLVIQFLIYYWTTHNSLSLVFIISAWGLCTYMLTVMSLGHSVILSLSLLGSIL